MRLDIPTLDPTARTAEPKPLKGEYWLDRKKTESERKALEDEQMSLARKRDLAACHGCRWPRCEYMPKKPRLEVSHCFEHRGMGGNPSGDRTRRDLLMLACFIHHSEIDTGDKAVLALTERGTDGPLSFLVKNTETGHMDHFATERLIGISEPRR